MRKTITIRDDYDDFGAVINCAIRYCIGRETYMPGLVTDWIMSNCAGMLTGRTLSVAITDIDEAERKNGLGMDCDVRTWKKFRNWLTYELNRIMADKREATNGGKR